MKRFPISPREADSAIRTMALLMEAYWDVVKTADKPQRSKAAMEKSNEKKEKD